MTALLYVALIFEASVGLVLYELTSLTGFARTYALIKSFPVRNRRGTTNKVARICKAVAEACVWYPKRVHCLQRSVVTTLLLRLHGTPATLVIGCRPVPVESHAWVEVEEKVVNDRQQYKKFFTVLDRL